MRLQTLGLSLCCALPGALGCTTLLVGRLASADGSVLGAHTNDGDGVTAGNLQLVRAEDWTLPQRTHGGVPQVAHTHAYFTKVGGYASLNEHQVGLAESTCAAVFSGNRSAGASLNIVDLSALGLERAATARQAVRVMGELAERYGYYDSGESLLVFDPREGYVFHVLPDDSGASAVWAAQRVPDDHVAVVTNSFTVRIVNFTDTETFLASANLHDVARRSGRWTDGTPLDFTRVFAGPEPGHKYASGRRMWRALNLLAPAAAKTRGISPTYDEYVSSGPYPATLGPAANLSAADLRAILRDYYQGTPFDLSSGIAAGPFGSPTRFAARPGSRGNWERPIAVSRTIVSFVAVCRRWLPAQVGGVLWFSMHSALTSVFVPFPVGVLRAPQALPEGFTGNTVQRARRGNSAWQAARFVFTASQLQFDSAIGVIRTAQHTWEVDRGEALVASWTRSYVADSLSVEGIAQEAYAHAMCAVRAWWELSDELLLAYNYADIMYPSWWIREQLVGYSNGPPESPAVPPPTGLELGFDRGDAQSNDELFSKVGVLS